jgi:hypothetical protein
MGQILPSALLAGAQQVRAVVLSLVCCTLALFDLQF